MDGGCVGRCWTLLPRQGLIIRKLLELAFLLLFLPAQGEANFGEQERFASAPVPQLQLTKDIRVVASREPTPISYSIVESEYEKEIKRKPRKAPQKLPYSTAACSCVQWAYSQTGDGSIRGYGTASRIPALSSDPRVGSYVLTRESRSGHLAIVTAVVGNQIVLAEANYYRCRVSYGRILDKNDWRIRGYR